MCLILLKLTLVLMLICIQFSSLQPNVEKPDICAFLLDTGNLILLSVQLFRLSFIFFLTVIIIPTNSIYEF